MVPQKVFCISLIFFILSYALVNILKNKESISKNTIISSNELCLNNSILYKRMNEQIELEVKNLEIYNEKLYRTAIILQKLIENYANIALYNKRIGKNPIKAVLVGSAANQIAINKSDIDISLLNVYATTQEEYYENQLALANYLTNNNKLFKSFKIYKFSRVTVIHFVFFIRYS